MKAKIQTLLGKEIVLVNLKATGACNHAYYVETADGSKYIIKQEREHKDFQPQNTLVIEAAIARQLYDLKLSVSTPNVCFVSEDPTMYGYVYIGGSILMDCWKKLREKEKISLCGTLGNFHAEIGQKFTYNMAKVLGIQIDMSSHLHPEVEKDYLSILADSDIPNEFKQLAKQARRIFDQTADLAVFQFMHNDAHHENIIIKDKKVVGIIDFGEAMYGDVAREFSRYIRDYPQYTEHIVLAYEKASGNTLSRARLITNAFLSGLIDLVKDYRKGGENQVHAENAIAVYKVMIHRL